MMMKLTKYLASYLSSQEIIKNNEAYKASYFFAKFTRSIMEGKDVLLLFLKKEIIVYWFNIYMKICVLVWALDVVLFGLMAVIKPLRRWCWQKFCQWSREFMEIMLDVFPELKEE